MQVVDDIRNPTWLALNPAQTRLYAISEIDNFQGTRNGAVASYAIDPDSFQLRRLGAVGSAGTTPGARERTPVGQVRIRRQLRRGQRGGVSGRPRRRPRRGVGCAPERGPPAPRARDRRSAGAIRRQRPRRSASAYGGLGSHRAIRHRQRRGVGSHAGLAARCAGRPAVARPTRRCSLRRRVPRRGILCSIPTAGSSTTCTSTTPRSPSTITTARAVPCVSSKASRRCRRSSRAALSRPRS